MAKNHKKRPKQGSSSSVDEEDMATSNCESLRSSIDSLIKVVTDGFANIHREIDNLRLELKTEIDGIKRTIKDIEKSLESTQEDVEDVKEDVKKVTRENLRFDNILETEDEDCKSVIQNIIPQMEIDSSTIRYHVVHRVGKNWKEGTGRL